jgi:hypothetical protein
MVLEVTGGLMGGRPFGGEERSLAYPIGINLCFDALIDTSQGDVWEGR